MGAGRLYEKIFGKLEVQARQKEAFRVKFPLTKHRSEKSGEWEMLED